MNNIVPCKIMLPCHGIIEWLGGTSKDHLIQPFIFQEPRTHYSWATWWICALCIEKCNWFYLDRLKSLPSSIHTGLEKNALRETLQNILCSLLRFYKLSTQTSWMSWNHGIHKQNRPVAHWGQVPSKAVLALDCVATPLRTCLPKWGLGLAVKRVQNLGWHLDFPKILNLGKSGVRLGFMANIYWIQCRHLQYGLL